MPHQNMLDVFLLEHCIIDRQGCTARITEDMLDPLIGQRLDYHFRAGHSFGHRSSPFPQSIVLTRSHSWRKPGNKKGPVRDLFSAHQLSRGMLSTLPMRLPTTRMSARTGPLLKEI